MAERSASEPVRATVAQAAVPVARQVLSASSMSLTFPRFCLHVEPPKDVIQTFSANRSACDLGAWGVQERLSACSRSCGRTLSVWEMQ